MSKTTSIVIPPDNLSAGPDRTVIPSSASDQAYMRTKLAFALSRKGNLSTLQELATPLECSIVGTADYVYSFFHTNGYVVTRKDWNSKKVDKKLARYMGWIYAFYAVGDVPLYVGETGRTFTDRFREHERKKKKKGNLWWPNWDRVKVLPCPEKTVRKVFESLIGVSGGYLENILQPQAGDNIFDEIILSLVHLGNNHQRLPIYPEID